MTTQAVVWTPLAEPPAALLAHKDAFWNAAGTELFLKVCKSCRTSATRCACGNSAKTDMLMFRVRNGVAELNQTAWDVLTRRVEERSQQPLNDPTTQPASLHTEAPQSELMTIALRCIDKGWYVFPLGERSKTPDGALAPNGFNSSSNNPAQIREWWTKSPNANVGIDLGRSNLTVLDFDNGKPPSELDLLMTLQVNTSRGTHVYFTGVSRQADMYFGGQHVGELKSAGGYVLSPFSIHPTGTVYSVAVLAPVAPLPQGLLEKLTRKDLKPSPTIHGDKIPYGQHDKELTRIAGKLRYDGLEENAIADALTEVCEKRCENYGSDYRQMCRKIAKSVCRYPVGKDTSLIFGGTPVGGSLTVINEAASEQTKIQIVDELSVDAIPPFQPRWVTGIYKKFVDVITQGTTLAPQFAFLATKVVVGARMAGKVKFENLDVEPRYYGAAIGETGSGKGEAWRRLMAVLYPEGLIKENSGAGVKIINSADSGAGLKECFFDPPENQPVVCYVDEVESLGNKATATRNPAILDTMIELADSTSISRMLAKKRKTKTDARLAMFMCGQDGDTYMKAFAGRTKLGLYDRLYPEYGVPVEAGELRPIRTADAYEMLAELGKLEYSGVMTMSPVAKDTFNTFWNSQPQEVRTKARWKKNVLLDAYMAAFGRGSKQVELEDMEIAIQLCARQLIIRKVCFRSEVPDKTGYYLGKIKDLTLRMQKQLAAGIPEVQVALSRRDYETQTGAYKNNEEHFFEKAWLTHSKVHLREVEVVRTNGQKYKKYLPQEQEQVTAGQAA